MNCTKQLGEESTSEHQQRAGLASWIHTAGFTHAVPKAFLCSQQRPPWWQTNLQLLDQYAGGGREDPPSWCGSAILYYREVFILYFLRFGGKRKKMFLMEVLFKKLIQILCRQNTAFLKDFEAQTFSTAAYISYLSPPHMLPAHLCFAHITDVHIAAHLHVQGHSSFGSSTCILLRYFSVQTHWECSCTLKEMTLPSPRRLSPLISATRSGAVFYCV